MDTPDPDPRQFDAAAYLARTGGRHLTAGHALQSVADAAYAAGAAATQARTADLEDLLGSVWLYIKWRYVTQQLTTPQKELFADVVDSKSMHRQAEDGETPRPVADRWWR